MKQEDIAAGAAIALAAIAVIVCAFQVGSCSAETAILAKCRSFGAFNTGYSVYDCKKREQRNGEKP